MPPALSCSNALQYNGDIAGQGVRYSFYIQNLILVLMIERSHKDAEAALWTLVSTSFGLTISALVQIGQGQMNLLQGILTTQLTWFAMFGTYLALASYSRSKGENSLVKVAAVIQTYFSTILTILMWALASRLPTWDCDETSEVRFVMLFGLSLPAKTSGRVVALVVASLVLFAYATITGVEFNAWVKRWREKRKDDIETTPTPKKRRGRGRKRPKKKNKRFRQRWVPSDVGPVFFGILLSQLFILAYFISTTELIIVKSKAQLSDTTTWGFGQVLALVVTIPSVLDFLQATRKKLLGIEESSPDDNEPSPKGSLTISASGVVRNQNARITVENSPSSSASHTYPPIVDSNRLAPPLLIGSRRPSSSRDSTSSVTSLESNS